MTQSRTTAAHRVLVGRDDALATIADAAAAARTDGGSLLILGAAGFGKTSLIEASIEAMPDWCVVREKCDSFESDLGFAAISSLLRGLNPLVKRKIPLPAADEDPITVGRTLLGRVDALDHPTAIFLDDAQWIDAPSARALRFLLRRIGDAPLLIAIAARQTENALVGLFSEPMPDMRRIELGPLTVEQTRLLAARILHHEISMRTATRLTEATQGSPLLLSMLLRELGDSITDAPHPAGWRMPALGSTPLSPAVEAALEDAGAPTASAAELVAVLRDPVTRPQLSTISLDLEVPIDVDGAVARGLVHSLERDGLTWLEPAHSMLADALAARMSPTDRTAIHHAAARVLTGHRALRHRVEAADRADHGLVDELIAAAHDAAAQGRTDQALSYARSAVHLAADDGRRERSLLAAGLVAMRTRTHERIFDLRPAIEALPDSLVRDAILVELRTLTGDMASALALAAQVLTGDDPAPEARMLRAHVAGCVPMALMATRDFGPVPEQIEIARALLERAPADPREVADEGLRWMVQPEDELLRLLGWQLTGAEYTGRPDMMRDAIDEIERRSWDSPGSAALADALVTRGSMYMRTGRLDAAHTDMARANELIDRFPGAWTAGTGRAVYTHVLFVLGRWDVAVEIAERAVALALDETDLSAWSVTLAASTLVPAARGESEIVGQRLADLSRAKQRIASPYDTDLPWIARAELARAQGDRVAQLDAAERGAEHARGDSTLGWATYRIDALAALGRVEEAESELEAVEAAESRWVPYYGTLGWLRARVADARCRAACTTHPDAAARLGAAAFAAYRAALADEALLRTPHPCAVAMLDGAALAEGLGEATQAVEWLQEASATFSRLGASDYLDRCRTLLERLEAPPQHEDPLAPLTARERQVALTIAAGMTNKEIAAHLYVSVTTVNFHVRNIMSKLGLSSRREVRGLLGPHAAGIDAADLPSRLRR